MKLRPSRALLHFIAGEIARSEEEAWVVAFEVLKLHRSGDLEQQALDLYDEIVNQRDFREDPPDELLALALMIGPLDWATAYTEADLAKSLRLLMLSARQRGYVRGTNHAARLEDNRALISELRSELERRSAAARRGAAVRHAESYQVRDRIFEWYRERYHLFKSMDIAAEAYMKEEPVSFRTARKHIGAAAKAYALRAKRTSSKQDDPAAG